MKVERCIFTVIGTRKSKHVSHVENELTIVLHSTNCAPVIDPRCSAHAKVRALPPLTPRQRDEDSSSGRNTPRVEDKDVTASSDTHSIYSSPEQQSLSFPLEIQAESETYEIFNETPELLPSTQAETERAVGMGDQFGSHTYSVGEPHPVAIDVPSPCQSDDLDFWDGEMESTPFNPTVWTQADTEYLERVYRERIW